MQTLQVPLEILEQSLFSKWEEDEAEDALALLEVPHSRLRRSIDKPLWKKLFLLQAYSTRPRPVYHYRRPVVTVQRAPDPTKMEQIDIGRERVPIQAEMTREETNEMMDGSPDSRKTRQSAPVFDSTLFMVLGQMMTGGKYSQEKLKVYI